MPRTRLAILGSCLLLAAATDALVHPPTATFTPVDEEQLAIPLLPAGAVPGADDLTYTADCLDTNPRRGLIALAWAPRGGKLSAQRIDVTQFHEGFETGRFDVSATLAAGVRAISLENPEPGIYYYWRVLSATPDGWVVSPVARFEAPICPSDGPVFDQSGEGE
jgi:hypothetical protein